VLKYHQDLSRGFSPRVREVADATPRDAGDTVSRDPCQTVAQIEYIALATENLQSTCDFYRLLGAVASGPSTDPGTGLRSCTLDFCGVRLELVEAPRLSQAPVEPGRSRALLQLGFALGSADAVDEVSHAVAADGHRVLEPPRRASELGRYASVVLDPDGRRIKLIV
jgi:catechol 2,3-dioxygenase-like lactoylglutathione lyase family enzyme